MENFAQIVMIEKKNSILSGKRPKNNKIYPVKNVNTGHKKLKLYITDKIPHSPEKNPIS